tara:strand:+ start:6343 stop:7746 length:1404 start_codon:yes stop_codon:yes gene_type:complete
MILKILQSKHFQRLNVYVFESLLPRLGAFIFLPLLFRYASTSIWAEIGLMIAMSEILSKVYLFGFQNSIFRFANDLSEQEKQYIFKKLIFKIFTFSTFILLSLEITNSLWWPILFEFEYGLPARTVVIISCFTSLNIYLIQYVKSLQLSRKLLFGSVIYTLFNFAFQFSTIFFISINYGKSNRMIVTAYLFSIALASTLRVIYYKKITKLKVFSKINIKEIDIKKFYNFSRPAAGIAFLSIIVSHGSKLVIQNNISLDILGKYFSYLSYAGIVFVIFAATQEYFYPILFRLNLKNTLTFRIQLFYFWTFVVIFYLLIFNRFSSFLIPESYMLSNSNITLIFLIQALSIQRSIAGMYYEINKKITTKLNVLICTSVVFLIVLLNISDLESYLNLFLMLYFIIGNAFLILSREFRFLLHFNFLQALTYIVIQNINLLNLDIIFIPIFIFALYFWSKSIFSELEKLRGLS